jgi:hypothetical protein
MHIPTSTVEYKELLTRLKRFQSGTLCALFFLNCQLFAIDGSCLWFICKSKKFWVYTSLKIRYMNEYWKFSLMGIWKP